MKIQAKDCQQGGLFQMEPEPGTRERNTLGLELPLHFPAAGTDEALLTNDRFSGYARSWRRSCPALMIIRWPPGVQSGGRIGW